MNHMIIFLGVCFFLTGCASNSPRGFTEIKMSPMTETTAFHFVPEMDHIPQIDSGINCSLSVADSLLAKIQSEAEHLVPFIEPQLTPQLLFHLSQWAKDQMKTSLRLKPLTFGKFEQFGCDSRNITFVTELDTLPTHSRIVVRNLKIFTVYNTDRNIISDCYITIRGQLFE